MRYLALQYAIINTLGFALLAVVGKICGTWKWEKSKARSVRLMLELADIEKTFSDGRVDKNEEVLKISRDKILISPCSSMPTPALSDAHVEIEYMIPTISWTARKGPPMVLFWFQTLFGSYYAIATFYEFLNGWKNISFYFIIVSCFFHIGLAIFTVKWSRKLHYICASSAFIFLTIGAGLAIVDIWEQLLDSTKVVACTGIFLYSVFNSVGSLVEKLAILEWFANIIFGLLPLTMALTINPKAPYYP